MSFSIYRIINRINGKSYIGYSKNPERRFKEHLKASKSRRYSDYNSHFKSAIRKYGVHNFEFSILENDIHVDHIKCQEILYIEKFDTYYNGYNSTIGGDDITGASLSEDTKLKMSVAKTGRVLSQETKDKMRMSQLGKKQSPEHKEKLRLTRIGRKMTDSSKDKISKTKTGKTQSPETIEKRRQSLLGKTYRKKRDV